MPNAEKLITLFQEAKAHQAGLGRERFLAEACRGEPELQQQLISLLRAHESAGDFLQNAIPSPTQVLGTAKTEGKIGHYKLLQQLGEGGCGVVYMAEQAEPVRRKVALKIIKLGMDTKQVVARFEAERQALALMDHPNIAKVFDAGATETGRPYFVMELVRGIKITDYCDQQHYSTRARLNLFIPVCQAVQHAHQKGIIHRDLKPSNILVAQHDTVAVPKVIDFGIAKATSDQPLTDKTLFTAFEQFIGTPAYMSPEQAQLSGLDLDTRTDIYSLGVLLYELLTGQPPFDPEELMKSGLEAMRRTIRETEPLRPSTRLTQELAAHGRKRNAGSAESNDRKNSDDGEDADESKIENPKSKIDRQLQVKELIPLLRGDLDWIVMKCLEKDRTRRYGTANDLAADLQRHLNNEPVTARPPSTTYRFRKLVRRNKLVFAAAALITLSVIAGFVGVLWQSVARQQALAETRRLLYATDMNLAQQALESMNLGQAVELLERHRPKPGEDDLRGFEWRYLWRLCQGDEEATLHGHTDTVTGVAFSPDGRLLASSSKDRTIRLWDVASQRPWRVLSNTPAGAIYSVNFSSDGRQLIAAGDGGVSIWETRTWTVLRSFGGNFRSSALTRDGRTVVAGRKTGVLVLTTPQGSEPFALPDTSGPTVFSSDEQRLATFSSRGISLWDVSSLSSNSSPLGFILWTNLSHSGEHELAFSPDGQIIAAGHTDGRVRLFDPLSGKSLADFEHSNRVDSLIFSSDGKTLASASAGQTVNLWDVAGKTNRATLHGHQSAVWSVTFSPDGQTLASGSMDQTIKLWTATPRPLTENLQLSGPHSRICADGTTVANWDRRRVQFLNINTRQVLFNVPLPTPNDYWNISSSGQVMTVVSNGWVRVWKIAAKKESVPFLIPPGMVPGLMRISPDGSTLAASSTNGHVRLWSLSDGREQRSLKNAGYLVAWLNDAVAAVGSNYDLTLWDYKTGRPTLTLKGHKSFVREIVFSPDGQTVATASWDHTARLWEVTTGRQIGLLGGHNEGLNAIDFSPDGRTLATGSSDDTAKLWNVATRQEVLTLRPRHGDILHLKFVPDGSALVTLSSTGSGKVWWAPSFLEADATGNRSGTAHPPQDQWR